MKSKPSNNLFFPGTIVLIGLIIAGGIFITRSATLNRVEVNKNIKPETGLKPITAGDKILGNPNADVIIVEYADFECHYCKLFNATMNDLMYEYGRTGKVAWIFRHFPIEANHKQAKGAAIASECVFRLGGNDAFWNYENAIFASSTDVLSSDNLQKMAVALGIDQTSYSSCINSPEILAKIDADIADGKIIYDNDPQFGTPYSFLVTKSGIQTTIIGNQPLSTIKALIDKFI